MHFNRHQNRLLDITDMKKTTNSKRKSESLQKPLIKIFRQNGFRSKWMKAVTILASVVVFAVLFSVFNANMVIGSASAEELTPETYQVMEETIETTEPAPPLEAVKQGEVVLDDLSGSESGPEEVSAGVDLTDQVMPAEGSDQVQETSEDIPLPEDEAVYTGEQESPAEPVPSETVSGETASESEPGDTLLLLGNEKQGIAIPPKSTFSNLFSHIFGAENAPDGEEE